MTPSQTQAIKTVIDMLDQTMIENPSVELARIINHLESLTET